MSTENQKQAFERQRQLAHDLFGWASETNFIAKPEGVKEGLDFIFRGFLESSYANDPFDRASSIVLFDHFNVLLDALHKYSHEDFQNLDLLNLKLGLNVS